MGEHIIAEDGAEFVSKGDVAVSLTKSCPGGAGGGFGNGWGWLWF